MNDQALSDQPRQILCDLIRRYGTALVDDRARCSGLLHDFCAAYKAEVAVLLAARDEGVPAALSSGQAAAGGPELLMNRLVKRLREDRLLTEAAARWAVESWALALGVILAPPNPTPTPAPAPTPAPTPTPEPTRPPPPPPTPKPDRNRWVIPALLGGMGLAWLGGRVFAPPPTIVINPTVQPPPSPPLVIKPIEPPNPPTVTPGPLRSMLSGAAAEAAVRSYYEALNRHDVGLVLAHWNHPSDPERLAKLAQNGEYYRLNSAAAETVEDGHAVVRVDVVAKARDQTAPVPYRGVIELEPGASGRWGIVRLRLERADKPSAPLPPVGGSGGAYSDGLADWVRGYYAALDRGDATAAVAAWKVPPKDLAARVKRIEYFKVNNARVQTATSGHASVWVDVVGKNRDEKQAGRWQGTVELEPVGAGKWAIVALNLK